MNLNKEKKTLIEIIALTIVILGITISSLFLFQKLFPETFEGFTGNAISSVRVVQTVPEPCNFTLYNGWNLASFFCISIYQNTTELFEPISYNSIFMYDASSYIDPWISYNPSLPNWTVQSLPETVSREQAFWISVSSDQNYYFNGSKKPSTTISLVDGWNLVGYPTSTSRNVSQAVLGITGSFVQIKTFNNSAKTYDYYNGTNGTITNTSKYQGYWIEMNSTGSWVVSW
jgi:hypothetical protein